MCAVSGIQDLIEQSPHHCLGVILAGGRSSRMGKDKATVRIGQRTMLDITRSLLDAAPLNNHIVVGGEFADWSEECYGHGPGRAICEVMMSTAIADSFAPDYVLFLPVDMPLLTAQTLRKLIDLAKEKQRAVYFDAHYLPLVIPLNEVTINPLKSLTKSQPSPSVRRVLNTLGAYPANFTGATAELANINSPADLTALSVSY
ncbi:molybdenum cofactor guanylyltransferase [Alteromonas gilva]|uniref:NTP transferase domain-containing protein n=1 Tax=Alteromonas gilva TaxID=2987522 RepID=A0ABT5L344_9ALTE|nr:NTP transferase domain-containing protein [Alteromonas gilva]MDC8831465.1 NTP transferase domain-containing protein [Alteromonas gilva]